MKISLGPLPRAIVLAAAAAAMTLGAAACGSSDDDKSAPTTAAPAGAIQPGTKVAAVPAGAPLIDQEDLKFKPNELTVKTGDKVYFKNSETAVHTVTIQGKNISGTMVRNDIIEWAAPSTAGTYRITCDYHPQMKATLTVE